MSSRRGEREGRRRVRGITFPSKAAEVTTLFFTNPI
jgi:hypothetical protein